MILLSHRPSRPRDQIPRPTAAASHHPPPPAADRAARCVPILARLQEGWAYDKIGLFKGLTRERVRQIVAASLRQREVDPAAKPAPDRRAIFTVFRPQTVDFMESRQRKIWKIWRPVLARVRFPACDDRCAGGGALASFPTAAHNLSP